MKEFKLVLLFLLYISQALAQSSNPRSKVQLSYSDVEENVVLVTDKNLYATNEVIHYKASYLCSRDLGGRQWSRVLYVELINENGTPVVQDKIELDINGAANEMLIPRNIDSGIYYIKAYTEWMRNHTVANYGFAKIAIVNPEKSVPSNIYTVQKGDIELYPAAKNDIIGITLADNSFSKRDTVNLEIVYNNNYSEKYDHCITVVKKGTLLPNEIKLKEKGQVEKQNIEYLPDFYGLNLSGELLHKDSQQPFKDVTVYISALNNIPFVGGATTNSEGEFLFSLPVAYNQADFYLVTNEQNEAVDIRINRGFCQEEIVFEKASFDFDKNLIDELLIDQQLKEKFSSNLNAANNGASKLQRSFYGSAKKIYYTKDFIDLPSLEEFFFEIVTDVTVFYNDAKPAIRSSQWNAFSSSPFLLLVDNIPILDIAGFLKIKTSAVEKVEVLNESYVLGNLKYGGIINIFSKQKDFAGMELPQNYSFINYEMLKPCTEVNGLESDPANRSIPDFRNCLYWNPWLKFKADSSLNLSFTTSDITGEFEVIVFSISKSDGKKQMSKIDFVVR